MPSRNVYVQTSMGGFTAHDYVCNTIKRKWHLANIDTGKFSKVEGMVGFFSGDNSSTTMTQFLQVAKNGGLGLKPIRRDPSSFIILGPKAMA